MAEMEDLATSLDINISSFLDEEAQQYMADKFAEAVVQVQSLYAERGFTQPHLAALKVMKQFKLHN